MTVFELVKDSVDIIDAAGRYGIDVNRHKKALCPFHSDSHPSLSFKGQRFTCFACGASGDVIDLVGRLANKAAIDTVRELGREYNLQIDLNKPAPSGEVRRRKQLQEKKKAFVQWEAWAWSTLASYFRLLGRWKSEYAPKNPDDQLHPRYVKSLHERDYIEYILDTVFGSGDLAKKEAFYNQSRHMVGRISQYLERESDYYADTAETNDNLSGIVFPFELIEPCPRAA